MKTFFLRVMLLVAAVVLVSGARGANKKVNVVFIGNSITFGASLPDKPTQAPPVVASQMLREMGYEVDFRNCGVSGCTTLDFLPVAERQWPNVVKAADALDVQDAQLVFSIMLGTNDSADEGPFGSPVVPAQYFTNLKVIIDELMSRYPKALFVVQYPIWYSPSTYNASRYLQSGLNRLQSYHPMIDRLVTHYAKEKRQRVFCGNRAAYDHFKEKQELFTTEKGKAGLFYLHPNVEGASQLARFWAESIKTVLP